MCIKCDLKKITGVHALSVTNAAIDKKGFRTIWGPYVKKDFEKILSLYPIFSQDQLQKYISFFAEPRLSELLGPIELVYRMLEKNILK